MSSIWTGPSADPDRLLRLKQKGVFVSSLDTTWTSFLQMWLTIHEIKISRHLLLYSLVTLCRCQNQKSLISSFKLDRLYNKVGLIGKKLKNIFVTGFGVILLGFESVISSVKTVCGLRETCVDKYIECQFFYPFFCTFEKTKQTCVYIQYM